MRTTLANDFVNPAYIDNGPEDKGYTHDGLTKREYFAALAMAAYNANSDCYHRPAYERAAWSVEDADALINALNEEKEVSHES